MINDNIIERIYEKDEKDIIREKWEPFMNLDADNFDEHTKTEVFVLCENQRIYNEKYGLLNGGESERRFQRLSVSILIRLASLITFQSSIEECCHNYTFKTKFVFNPEHYSYYIFAMDKEFEFVDELQVNLSKEIKKLIEVMGDIAIHCIKLNGHNIIFQHDTMDDYVEKYSDKMHYRHKIFHDLLGE